MRNYYVHILLLLLGASAFVFLSCHEGSMVGPTYYFAEEVEKVAFSSEGYEHFHIQNLRGNVTIENSDNDSIKITLTKMATSEFSEDVAQRNMLWIAAGLDSAVQDTAVYVIYWEAISFDINLRVDLEVQVPAGINFSSSITYSGNQDIAVNIPRGNTGKINIFNNEGNVRIILPQSASATIIAEVGIGRIIFDHTFNIPIEDEEVIDNGHGGVSYSGVLNDGVGSLQIIVDMGIIIFAGT